MNYRKTTLALTYILAIAMVVWTLPLNSVEASGDVPVKGSFGGNGIITVNYPYVHISTVGVGQMSHLGRTTFQSEIDVLIGPQAATGTFTFTAANGDTLTGTTSGIISPPDQLGVSEFDLTDTFTGGTGRFSGASGSVLVHGVSQATGPSSSVLQFTLGGTISRLN